jgi:electron transport complex protein RnfA
MFIKKTSEALFRALGIYLPLITTNCAVLGVALFQTSREYNFTQSVVFALGASGGFALAIIIMSVIRERLELSDIPDVARGTALVLFIAGILSMAFMGFAGMGAGE